ncbi:MAG: hypothetical protein IT542_02605 [Rubellimicrobium sp.]|nr:hypothetical protein [Rubellimicrobium sp.]
MTATAPDPHDPKGLIRESYRIAGITPGECRSIFLDWALSLPQGADEQAALAALLARHAPAAPAHPMTATLRAGQEGGATARRRGGRAGRHAGG